MRWIAFGCQPSAMNWLASQSSNSGCVGRSPRAPKSLGVATIPRPRWNCHRRFTSTRASKSPAPYFVSVIQLATARRRYDVRQPGGGGVSQCFSLSGAVSRTCKHAERSDACLFAAVAAAEEIGLLEEQVALRAASVQRRQAFAGNESSRESAASAPLPHALAPRDSVSANPDRSCETRPTAPPFAAGCASPSAQPSPRRPALRSTARATPSAADRGGSRFATGRCCAGRCR